MCLWFRVKRVYRDSGKTETTTLCRDHVGYILWLYRDSGKENGNY